MTPDGGPTIRRAAGRRHSRRGCPSRSARRLLVALCLFTPAADAARAQEVAPPPVGREAAEALRFPPLEFRPPEPERHEILGVPVFLLEDHALPLVNVYARFRGGFGLFGRDVYAAATALPGLLRSGGTTTLPPDSVDVLLEYYAVQTAFGGGGESSFSSVNVLREHLEPALELWADILRHPRFDPDQVEVWRGQELESARRRRDDPTRLAFSEFNRLMYGDHPVGWEMGPSDLEPEDLSREKLLGVHHRVFCPDQMILGVTGDITWEEVQPLLERLLEGWAPCPGELPEPPKPDLRSEATVFLIPRELTQSTVVMAHPTVVRQGDHPDYFASRIANSILGASGFSSRLMTRVRTERGYAYSASSLWTTPREHDGIVGAVTQTQAGSTVAATRLILETMEEMTRSAPRRQEVETAVEEIVNGFVFNFEDAGQVVSRQMAYLAQELPADWLGRYLEGIQRVEADDVLRVLREHLRPEEMTILILGDPEAFDEPLEGLGPVRVWEVVDEPAPAGVPGAP